jgi:hypothetical protein
MALVGIGFDDIVTVDVVGKVTVTIVIVCGVRDIVRRLRTTRGDAQ